MCERTINNDYDVAMIAVLELLVAAQTTQDESTSGSRYNRAGAPRSTPHTHLVRDPPWRAPDAAVAVNVAEG